MNEFLLETTQEAVSEVESAKPKPFRKFTVVKHKEASLQADSPNWDFNNNSDVQNVNFSNCQIDDEYSEAEDFFDENCNFKKDNLINCRDAEGQDTITSLKNNHFLKKLGKKKYSTNLTSSFSDFRTGQEAQGVLKENSSNSENPWDLESLSGSLSVNLDREKTGRRSLTIDRALSTKSSSITKLQESHSSLNFTNRRESLLNFIKSDSSIPLATVDLNNSIERNLFVSPKLVDQQVAFSCTNIQDPVTKSDQVFEVLKEAIQKNDKELLDKEFIEQVLETLKLQQRKDKQRKDNVKKMCRALEITTFLLIIMMTVFLIFNVSHQLHRLHRSTNNISSVA